jgi:hypothetical protein
MFILNSDITIGNFHFKGVHEVRIHRSIHGFTDTAAIKLPSMATLYTPTNRSNPEKVTTSDKFKVNDPVTIQLGYNGTLKEEFRGFVKEFNLNMPLEIICEGYSYLLNKKTFSGSWKSTTVIDLLKMVTEGTAIKLNVVDDLGLTKVAFTGFTGTRVLSYLSEITGGALRIFFIQPDVLWAGLLYTLYSKANEVLQLPTVQYKLGFNAIKQNSLRLKNKNDDPTGVEFSKRLPSGKIITATAGDAANGKIYRDILNSIPLQATLQSLANEKQLELNYNGYEGSIKAFLQPYCLPGYKVYVEDKRYPDGYYLAESVQTTFGSAGARRSIELGLNIGFSNSAK